MEGIGPIGMKENRGDRKPGGRTLASGSRARCAKEEGSRSGRFRADARQGESNERPCSNEEFAELRRSDTKEGGGVAEGERLRWDG